MNKLKRMLLLETAATEQHARLTLHEQREYAAAHPRSTFAVAADHTMMYHIKRAPGGGHSLSANGEHLRTYTGRDSENRAADGAMKHASTVHKGPYKIKRPGL